MSISHDGDSRPPADVVRDHIADQGGNGATVDEIEEALGVTRGSVIVVLAFLLMQGRIETRGMQRLDRANRFQNVYFATED